MYSALFMYVFLLLFILHPHLWWEVGFSQVWFWQEADLQAQVQDPGSRLAACCRSVLLPDALCTEHPSEERRCSSQRVWPGSGSWITLLLPNEATHANSV